MRRQVTHSCSYGGIVPSRKVLIEGDVTVETVVDETGLSNPSCHMLLIEGEWGEGGLCSILHTNRRRALLAVNVSVCRSLGSGDSYIPASGEPAIRSTSLKSSSSSASWSNAGLGGAMVGGDKLPACTSS